MKLPSELWYLRSGRERRGRGEPVERDPATGAVKVSPKGKRRRIWVSVEEIQAGKLKKA
jgi:hypothetical protein